MDENPFETSEDNAFYGMMVEYIHDHFVELEESSKEIEKIINIYLKYTYKPVSYTHLTLPTILLV